MSKRIILGESLISTLKKVNDKISTFLLELNSKEDVLDLKFSYIDAENDPSMFSYLPIVKEEGLSEDEKWKAKTRTSVKIGRVVRSILQSKNVEFNDAEIESFVNKYRCARDNGNFIFSCGKEFGKYYNENTYQQGSSSGSSLMNSCMRFEKCQEWFTIYKENPQVVGVLALLNDYGKVEGRALIWKDILIDGVGSTYMDRIYSISGAIEEKFKQYATTRGWWFKIRQSNDYPEISNGTKTIAKPVIIAQIRSDVNYNYKVKSPYVDSLRQMKILSKNGQYGLFLTNNLEGSSYRQNYGNHQSGVDINHNYTHSLDKPLSLAQVVNKDMNDVVKVDKNTFTVGGDTYKVFDYGDELNLAVRSEFMKKPFENIKKYGINLSSNIQANFYRLYRNELIKYIKDNKSKVWLNLKGDSNNYVRIFSKLSKEEFFQLITPFITDRNYYRKFSDLFQNSNFGFGQVITSHPYNYTSWDQLREFNELNQQVAHYGYERNNDSRKAVYEVAGWFLEEYGPVEIKQKYFSPDSLINDSSTDSYIIDLLHSSVIRIDILDFLETMFSDADKFKKLDGFINMSDVLRNYINEGHRKELLSSDNQEHCVLRHYIYKVS